MNYSFHHDLNQEIAAVRSHVHNLGRLRERRYDVWLPDGIDIGASQASIDQAVRSEFNAKAALISKASETMQALVEQHAKRIDDFFAQTFKHLTVPDSIPVYLSAYGPGGSYRYNPAEILARYDSKFQASSLHNVIHETVHIVVELPIIQNLNLDHDQKETLVCRICMDAPFLDPPPKPYMHEKNLPPEWRARL